MSVGSGVFIKTPGNFRSGFEKYEYAAPMTTPMATPLVIKRSVLLGFLACLASGDSLLKCFIRQSELFTRNMDDPAPNAFTCKRATTTRNAMIVVMFKSHLRLTVSVFNSNWTWVLINRSKHVGRPLKHETYASTYRF